VTLALHLAGTEDGHVTFAILAAAAACAAVIAMTIRPLGASGPQAQEHSSAFS
jgi:hypothetical protein